MSDRFVAVVDAGTSAIRCYLYSGKADIAAYCSEDWTYAIEENASPYARSFDALSVWEACCRVISRTVERANACASDIAAVSVTSQRQGVAFLDESGGEVYLGPNTDLRAIFEGAAIDDKFASLVYETTGHLPSFLFAPAKLKWFQTHRAEDYERIACALTIADWIVWRLTGVMAGESTLASEAGLVQVNDGTSAQSLLHALDKKLLEVPIVQSGTVVGELSESVAQKCGLISGTPVVVAGADTQCGLLGLGLAHDSQLGIVAGWSTAIQMITDHVITSPERRTWAGRFLENGKWVLESSPGDQGNSYHWLAKTLYGEFDGSFDNMNAIAMDVPPGSDGVKVFLGPPRMDMSNLGMRPGGFILPVPLTYGETRRGHLVRATLESFAYSIKCNIEQIEELAERTASQISVGGGMTRTPAFAQILSNVLDREISVSRTPQVSAFGAYLCALKALGDFPTLEDAARSVSDSQQTVEPDIINSSEYQDHYGQWLETAAGLEGLNL